MKTASFKGKMLGEITIYVWIGREDARKPVRYFITKNRDVSAKVHKPRKWKYNAFCRDELSRSTRTIGTS